MLTKQEIKELKITGNGAIGKLVREHKTSNGYVLNILENLGQLPNNFDGSFLPELLDSKSNQVRYWTVKNLGKLTDDEHLKTLKKVATTDKDTTVRREAVSSIGRMRNPKAKKILFVILLDTDPKVVCQAIRGLLVFKGDKEVDEHLKPLINHQNEMVRTVIYKEFFATQKTLSHQPHTESYDYLKNVVVNGDTIETMKLLKDESIHLTFTSPPYYNARDYSIYPSYKHYLEFLAAVFKQVHRITKEGRFLILNTSPIIIPRVSRSHSSKRYPIPFDIHPYLVEMGWEFIDDIVWMKPEASVKNRVGGFQQHRKPLGYKPNSITEYLMVYRKSTEKLLDWNIRQYDWKTVKESKVADGFETNNIWQIDPCFNKVHTAVFPVELCKRVIQYYSFKHDLVFDPFGGSGTVGKTAKSLDRHFFLTEKDEQYFGYMKSKKSSIEYDKYPTKFLPLKEFQEKYPMTLTEAVAKNIIRKLLRGDDYRIEVVTLINAEFLQFAIDFFKKIVDAKLQSKSITSDWYKEAFLNPKLPASEIAINSGLNKKTIHNMFNSSTREVVIDASNEHYDILYKSIQELVKTEHELELTLTIKFKGVSVDLNVSESLIVINTLAVKRAELRGGLWSTAGKRVENPLMQTLCKLYSVSEKNYRAKYKKDNSKGFDREIDFYLLKNGEEFLCEVKLMGRGNPESADAVIARETDVFIADKLSEQNKNQLDHLKINWIELRTPDGYKKFQKALEKLKIPHQDYKGNLDKDLDKIFGEIFKQS